jgi:microcystin-dependent protein
MTYFKKAAITAFSVAAVFMAAPNSAKAGGNPFIGEIQATGVFGFCQRGSLAAEGQLLPINLYTALFSLLGTTFGGDGRTTFGLPDLRSRSPIGVGNGPGLTAKVWGQKGGTENTTLTINQMASHNHIARANNLDGNLGGPGGKLLAAQHDGDETVYSDQPANRDMSTEMIANTGSGLPVSIIAPTSVIRYCIFTQGIYPSRS